MVNDSSWAERASRVNVDEITKRASRTSEMEKVERLYRRLSDEKGRA